MIGIFIAILLVGLAIAAGRWKKQNEEDMPPVMQRAVLAGQIGACLLAVFLLSMTSWVSVGRNQTAHLNKIYGWTDLPRDRIIATNGEKGPQAEVIGPGFHFMPLVRVINDIYYEDIIRIPEGNYGFLNAKDGKPLRANQFIADAWPEGKNLLDAREFFASGGQKGPQLNVLPPGEYRINKFLWEVTLGEATSIPDGHVGVIKSNVVSPVRYGNLNKEQPNTCWQKQVTASTNSEQPAPISDEGKLVAVLVPVGCIGVWEEALTPGRYYINRRAHEVKIVDTRVQTWEYKGGYTFRQIDLAVDDDGKITQRETAKDMPVPQSAADRAVQPRIEGWVVPIELRVLVQVTPENAPFVVASVGGLAEIEDRIMTPTIRSVVRNELGAEGRRVLDVADNRNELEQVVERAIRPEGLKAGIVIKEIRFGDPAIPPELLVSRLRQQLADQLTQTYRQEKVAQTERINRERERATANQQSNFVQAEIGVKVAEKNAEAAELRGKGIRAEMTHVAAGQKEQAQVLGEDKVLLIALADKLLATLERKPELVRLIERLVPTTVVTGSGGFDLSAAAAIIKQQQPSTAAASR